MSDDALLQLAQAAGVAPHWRDAFGQMRAVSPDTLRQILAALDVPALTEPHIRDSLARLRDAATTAPPPPLITADANQPIPIAAAGRFRITLETGETIEGQIDAGALPPIAIPGYHGLECGDLRITLAVAPPHCHGIREVDPAGRLWGLAAQLYALRRPGDGGIGDFAALRDFVRHAAATGADAVAISPIHAQFSADPDRFSPYSPSSRTELNVLHADADDFLPPDSETAHLESLPLVDWPAAGRAKLARFRRAFATLPTNPALAAAFAAYRAQRGEPLDRHATFEALHANFFGNDSTRWHWRNWPAAFRQPHLPAVAHFAQDHESEITFHAFVQFLADRGLAAAQAAARDAGMKIGLIADLAVGADSGGAQAWSRQAETLLGLSIGAPPDLLSTTGQDWGLAAFSPTGLIRHGFAAYIEMLRGAMRHAGGVRIDHVMGLARLWVLPEGATAQHGAYLHYPLADLLRLIALESHRHQAIILGEDLGTVPDGFQQQLNDRDLMGLRVLWFEWEHDRFRPPAHWTRDAAAMTSTHDLATVAGWWRGHDLDLRRPLGMLGDDAAIWYAYENRANDRPKLWDVMTQSGAATGPMPPPETPLPVVDAAIRHVAGASCDFAILPIEDALATEDQPNLPGTTTEHPNWRRRLALDAQALFADPGIAARLDTMDTIRKT